MAQGVGSDASRALTVVWVLLSLTFVFVLLRLYVRVKLTARERWAADDYYYFASFVSLLRQTTRPTDQDTGGINDSIANYRKIFLIDIVSHIRYLNSSLRGIRTRPRYLGDSFTRRCVPGYTLRTRGTDVSYCWEYHFEASCGVLPNHSRR